MYIIVTLSILLMLTPKFTLKLLFQHPSSLKLHLLLTERNVCLLLFILFFADHGPRLFWRSVGTAPVVSSRSTEVEQNSSGSLETRVDSVYSCERNCTPFEPEIADIKAYTLKVSLFVSTFIIGLINH